MELTDSLKALFIETAKALKGSARRLFMARSVGDPIHRAKPITPSPDRPPKTTPPSPASRRGRG